MPQIDHLKSIAFLVSERMDDLDEFEDVFQSDHAIDFGYKGVQYCLAFGYSYRTGYRAMLDNYAADVDLDALAIGRMLRGEFQDVFVNLPIAVCSNNRR